MVSGLSRLAEVEDIKCSHCGEKVLAPKYFDTRALTCKVCHHSEPCLGRVSRRSQRPPQRLCGGTWQPGRCFIHPSSQRSKTTPSGCTRFSTCSAHSVSNFNFSSTGYPCE